MKLIWLDFIIRVMIAAAGCYGLYAFLVNYLGKEVWFLRMIGIDILDLSLEEKEKLSNDITYAIDEYIEGIMEDDDCVFDLSLYKLNKEFGHIVSDEYPIDYIEKNINLDERIESFDVYDGRLILEINSYVLKEAYEAKVTEWERQGQLERIEYYGSRGVC